MRADGKMAWPQVRLDEVTVAIKDGTHGTHVRVEDGIPLLSAKNITESGEVYWDDEDSRITEQEYQNIHRTFRLQPDDLLLTIVGSLGRRAVHDGARVTFQRSVAYVRPATDLILPRFLFHALGFDDFQRQLVQRSNATAQAGLYLGELGQCVVPLPPTPQQARIAAVLDTLDEVISRTEQVIGKLQQMKQGVLHDLLTRGVDENGALRPPPNEAPNLYKDSPLGLVASEWRVSVVGTEFDIQLGKMLSKLAQTGRFTRPYLSNKAVQWDRIDTSDLPTMDFTPGERAKFNLLPGDLLVCEGGEVGRTAMWRGELEGCYFQKAVHRLRPKQGYDPRLMLRFMKFAATNGLFANFTSQTSIAHLTQEKLAFVPLLVPSPDEQRRIADRLDAFDAALTREGDLLAKVQALKQGILHDLLTGQVRAPAVAEVSA
jgi:type I restriction enzyme, S subunit